MEDFLREAATWIILLMVLSSMLTAIIIGMMINKNKEEVELEETEKITEKELEEIISQYEKNVEKIVKYKMMLKRGFKINTANYVLNHKNGKYYMTEKNLNKK
jgi:uncharacterized protein YneF (UPF0154 family)